MESHMPRIPLRNLVPTSLHLNNPVIHWEIEYVLESSSNMQLALSEPLSTLVAKRFAAAKEGGHLIFSPTQVTTIQTSGISVCPRLAPISQDWASQTNIEIKKNN